MHLFVRPERSRTSHVDGAHAERALRRGLTVIEILVSATLALVMIVAMVRLFANIGGGVSVARATLEMSGQLRMASNRLRRDLEGLTLPVRPWPSPADGLGYFEYVEGPGAFIRVPINSPYSPSLQPGPSRDADADGDGTLDHNHDYDMNMTPDYQEGVVDTSLGDIDDVLMFTSRSVDQPFVGKIHARAVVPVSTGFAVFQRTPFNGPQSFTGATSGPEGSPTTIESPNAEIAWWTRARFFDGAPGTTANVWEQGEEIFVTLHRRVLLIRPDLNQDIGPDADMNGTPDFFGMAYILGMSANDLAPRLKTFLNMNDVSVRMERHQVSGTEYIVFVANSLADLTVRENRFAHLPIIRENPSLGSGNFVFRRPTVTPAPMSMFPTAPPLPIDRDPRSITSLARVVKSGDEVLQGLTTLNESTTELGEDVILSNVVAFDVRGFDPQAVVRVNASSPNTALIPGDPGYSGTPIGQGAFVDLNYDNASLTGANITSLSGLPHTKSRMNVLAMTNPTLTYDTWSTHYESDGLDQNNDGEFSSPTDTATGFKKSDGMDNDMNGLTDEQIDGGTNGFDDDGINGVDDPGERDTSPPYPVPLRGLKVSIRVVEVDTKQVRQTSVVTDFIPE